MTTAANTTFGYGPSVRVFSGEANDYELWEDYFISRLRMLNIHHALDRYESERPTDASFTSEKLTSVKRSRSPT